MFRPKDGVSLDVSFYETMSLETRIRVDDCDGVQHHNLFHIASVMGNVYAFKVAIHKYGVGKDFDHGVEIASTLNHIGILYTAMPYCKPFRVAFSFIDACYRGDLNLIREFLKYRPTSIRLGIYHTQQRGHPEACALLENYLAQLVHPTLPQSEGVKA